MKVTSYYPVIMTEKVAETAAFYIAHFGFEALFEADWYVHLQSTLDERVTLAVLDGSHETIPLPGRGRVSGLILNFEVDDVDAEHVRAGIGELQFGRRDVRPDDDPASSASSGDGPAGAVTY